MERIAKVRDRNAQDIELLIVDDDSRDGTVELITSRIETWLRLIVRTDDRGLSSAVLEGFRQATGDVLVCMDADLSHPPEAIPVMLQRVLARPLTSIRDPMSGFFALSRATYASGRDFSPIGYKIGLELIVKCRCQRVVEVPIHFDQRKFGESKLNLKQRLLYLQHLRRLYMFRYGV